MIVGATPRDQAGGASASRVTDTKLGLALGVTIVGKLGTAEYRNEVTDAMPTGIPPGTGRTRRTRSVVP
jgi:MFS transporter, DHA2 family, multidrug resistance protein